MPDQEAINPNLPPCRTLDDAFEIARRYLGPLTEQRIDRPNADISVSFYVGSDEQNGTRTHNGTYTLAILVNGGAIETDSESAMPIGPGSPTGECPKCHKVFAHHRVVCPEPELPKI